MGPSFFTVLFLAILYVGIILLTENSQGRCNGVRLFSERGLRVTRVVCESHRGTLWKFSRSCGVANSVRRIRWWIEGVDATKPAMRHLDGCALLVPRVWNLCVRCGDVGMRGSLTRCVGCSCARCNDCSSSRSQCCRE